MEVLVDLTRAARRMTDLPRAGMALAFSAPQQVADVWRDVDGLVQQAGTLLARLKLLLNRAEEQFDEIEALLQRLHPLEQAAAEAISNVHVLTTGVEGTRTLAEKQVQRLESVLDDFEPSLRAIAPIVDQGSRTLHPHHLAGLAALLDQLPQLVDRIEPALTGMAQLAPEMEQVTERMDNVGQVVEGLPGAKVLRRRGQAREDTP